MSRTHQGSCHCGRVAFECASHYFCRHCGIHPFMRPRLDPTKWAVNVRCLHEVDLSSLKVRQFDGAHWEEAAKAFASARSPNVRL